MEPLPLSLPLSLPLLFVERGLRSCWRRDCWARGLGVLRGELEGPARKRGRSEDGVGLGLRLNEILGCVSVVHCRVSWSMHTVRRDCRSAGRLPAVLPRRCGHLQRLPAFRSMGVRTAVGWRMLRHVHVGTGLLTSLTSHRRVFSGRRPVILHRRIVSWVLELPVESLRRADCLACAPSATSRVSNM